MALRYVYGAAGLLNAEQYVRLDLLDTRRNRILRADSNRSSAPDPVVRIAETRRSDEGQRASKVRIRSASIRLAHPGGPQGAPGSP